MKIYNSLSKKLEKFEPIGKEHVGVYTCGPTVYSYLTIGNWRTYLLADIVVRSLEHFGYKPEYVMNITDVGHLTGDNQGDADTGEDRLEKAAKSENKTAWDIAEFYTKDFLEGFDKLNLTRPKIFSKATEHITEQIDLVRKIEEAGYAYKISDGIYFDTKAYEKAGNNYGELSNIDQVKEGARVEPNPEKRDPRDFALWKFSYEDGRKPTPEESSKGRDMEWDSPWGLGFPGWHIECSAMSMKYLGEQFDIHIGGEDLRSTHHPNEVAQSEAATGKKPFVKYWMHGAFLQVDGGRMGKSLGNAYTLHDIINKGFSLESLRYFYMTAHYRAKLNFTWEALESAENAYQKLVEATLDLADNKDRNTLSDEKLDKIEDFNNRFEESLANDFNMPQSLSVLWEVVKSNIPSTDKLDLIYSFDEVFGFGLRDVKRREIPEDIKQLAQKRHELRQKGDYQEADKIREEIEQKGYNVLDTKDGVLVN